MTKKLIGITWLAVVLSALFLSTSCTGGQNEPSPEPVVDSVIVTNVPMFKEEIWDYTKNPDALVFKGNTVVVVDMGTTWCGGCKIAAPIIEKIAKKYPGKARVYSVDCDVKDTKAGWSNGDIYNAVAKLFPNDEYFVGQYIPAFLLISKDGKTYKGFVGVEMDKDGNPMLEQLVSEFIEQNQ